MTTRRASSATARLAGARQTPLRVRVVQLPHARGLPLPAYHTRDSAGLDLVAALPDSNPLRLSPGSRALVPTGLVVELPPGYEAQVRPRSGLALKHGITVLNSPGTIDADYRGEVQVILVNLGAEVFVVRRGERIAQMIVAAVVRAALAEAQSVTITARGAGGFGSTGQKAAASKPQSAAERGRSNNRSSKPQATSNAARAKPSGKPAANPAKQRKGTAKRTPPRRR